MSRRPALQPETITPADAQRIRQLEAVPVRAVPPATSNPTFGPAYWFLGLGAATPALLGAVGLLACTGQVPGVPRLPVLAVLGVLLALLAVGTVVTAQLNFPAWSHPGVALLPVLGLFLPIATLHGQIAARINGDPAPAVVAPLLVTWCLLAAAAIVGAGAALVVGRHAPSFSGTSLLPLPILLSWTLVLVPTFREEVVIRALASALALLACATFVAWIAPLPLRPLVPLAAIALQFAAFWSLRLNLIGLEGAMVPILWLDVALYVALVALVGAAPFCAGWMRLAGWPTVRRLLGG